MADSCFVCKGKVGILHGKHSRESISKNYNKIPPSGMSTVDLICGQCMLRLQSPEDVRNNTERTLPSSGTSPMTPHTVNESKPFTKTKEEFKASGEITNAVELTALTNTRHDSFKRDWQKGRVVQFKNDKIAILMRAHNSQVEFIVAYDQVTREGFRLMSIDEGKETSAGGFTGGISSYYYFQKMDYVR